MAGGLSLAETRDIHSLYVFPVGFFDGRLKGGRIDFDIQLNPVGFLLCRTFQTHVLLPPKFLRYTMVHIIA